MNPATTEMDRLAEDAARTKNWKRWGPYLSERQWATVREDYSPEGATCFCSASSSMVKPAGGWAQATKPDGRRWSLAALKV
jgi:hypothetical protein